MAARTAPTRLGLALAMVLAVVALASLAVWDEARERTADLDDFAAEQASLAAAVAGELEARLAITCREAVAVARGQGTVVPGALRVTCPAGDGVVDLVVAPDRLLGAAARLERPGAVRVLVAPPGSEVLRGRDGSVIVDAALGAALTAGGASVWLDRAAAARLGLHERRAAAGVARVDAGALGRWGVVVVASAERERDRELRARVRLVLGVGLTAALLFAFGGIGLRKQRRELVLERELALQAAARESDERLARASRIATLGTLAMGIAHEVSTPLGVIAGRAEQLAAKTGGDERAARAVQAIADEAERIRRVVRGFLALARSDAPALGAADPQAVVRSAVAMVRHRFASAGVALDVDVGAGMPSVHCDRTMLEQAVVNLLLNACDASPPGGRVLARAEAEGERVTFTVRDEGTGISPELAQRVTEPFFTTKPEGQGTGLGLAITSEIVKLHHGELALRPASPRGTVATIVVPLRGAIRDAA